MVPDADIECAPAVPLKSNIPNPVDNQNTRTKARLSGNFPSKRLRKEACGNLQVGGKYETQHIILSRYDKLCNDI